MSIKYCIISILILVSCSHSNQESTNDSEKSRGVKSEVEKIRKSPLRKKAPRFSVYTHLEPEGWGYVISENNKILIDQQTIPGIPGIKGFETSDQAMRVADLVRTKMEKGIFPPTVSEEELQKLGISWMN